MVKKIITLLLVMCCLNTYSQYKPPKRYKNKKAINTKVGMVVGGLTFIAAGTIAMRTRGDVPFKNNGTKWKTCPSEWAIIGGFSVVTLGIIYKF
tara:strand:- start:998 stop:1279 length:282 start_codon:yes stop_codon:yes gene_type:complete